MVPRSGANLWQRLLHAVLIVFGAPLLTLLCFLVLPLLQAIANRPAADLTLTPVDTTELPPPPPVLEEPPPEDDPQEEPPPELAPDNTPLDLAQLELVLQPGGFGDGFGVAAALEIRGLGSNGGGGVESLFSLADLDQKPRPIHQPEPVLTPALRRKRPAAVIVLFVVDQSGRVETPIVQSSTDPAFDAAVLAAVKQWKYEPGKRRGEPVRFRVRQPFQFEG